MMLFNTEPFSRPKPKSVGDLATAMGLTLLEYLHQEAEANNKFYGIGPAQRYELVGWAGLQLPNVSLGRFRSGDLPEKPKDLRRIWAEWDAQRADRPIKPKKERSPMALEKKQGIRCSRLLARARKQFSFPSLRHDWIMSEVVKKPEYFGCQLLTN
jgi:hypothetical protein